MAADDVDDRNAVEARAMQFLARRGYAVRELRDKLVQRDFDPQIVDEVLAEYVERGWLDDEAFASHQAQLLVEKGWGPLGIRRKLTDHGIPSSLAQSTVDALDVDWLALACARVERKYGALREDRDRQRAFRHLTSRGFTPQTARRAVLDP